MKDDFFIKIETWHKPDLGTLENVHGLDPNTWKTVEIVHIDIADRSQVEPAVSTTYSLTTFSPVTSYL